MVRSGDCPHHAVPAGAVLPGGPARHKAQPARPPRGLGRGLVSQATANLRRHPGRRAPRNLAGPGFFNIPLQRGRTKTPWATAAGYHLRTLPSSLIVAKWPKSRLDLTALRFKQRVSDFRGFG